jgi:hypothetical protein
VANDSPSPHIVNLQGTGISSGHGTLSVTGLDFGFVADGTHSQPQGVSLTNTGAGTLTLGTIIGSPQYAQTNNCGASLKQGASCTISIQFAPTLLGILQGTVSVQDDGGGSPHLIALTGVGQ